MFRDIHSQGFHPGSFRKKISEKNGRNGEKQRGEIWGNDHQSKTESKFVLLIDENDKDLELNYNKLSIPPHRGRYESYSRQ